MSKPIISAPKSTGTNTPRDIKDRFADILNVKDFGAVGDGITDDTAAFTAAAANGKPIYVPYGNYKTSTNISGRFFSLGNVTKTGDGNVNIYDLTQDKPSTIFVDATNGNDNNDGESSDKAVKSITKALEISSNKISGILQINIATGTYTGDLVVQRRTILNLLGDIIINGSIEIKPEIFLRIAGTGSLKLVSSTFNITAQHSMLFCEVSVEIQNTSTNSYIILSDFGAYVRFEKRVTCVVNCGQGFLSGHNSTMLFASPVTASGSVANEFVSSYQESILRFNNSLDASDLVVNGNGLKATINSFIHAQNCQVKSALNTVEATYNSFINIEGSGSLTNTAAGNVVHVTHLSKASLVAPVNNTISLNSTNARSDNAVYAGAYGHINLYGSGTFSFSGEYKDVIAGFRNTVIVITQTLTLNGSPTGRRYYITDYCGLYIEGHSAGVNRIPGSAAGTIEPNTYNIYA